MFLCRIPSGGSPRIYWIADYEQVMNDFATWARSVRRTCRGWAWKGGWAGIGETSDEARARALMAREGALTPRERR